MIERSEVQGNVLYAYGDAFPYARYVLLGVENQAAARAKIGGWLDQVTFGQRPRNGERADGESGSPGLPPALLGRPHLNIAFTFSGLKRLGVPDDLLYAFPKEFVEGARARAGDNGDCGESAPEHWMDGLGSGDVLLAAYGRGRAELDDFLAGLLAGTDGFMPKLHDLAAARLQSPGRTEAPGDTDRGADCETPSATGCDTELHREHFGFADGCSQPAIQGVHDDPVGGGVYKRMPPTWWRPFQWLEELVQDLGLMPVPRRWRAISTGEFLLGYENEDGRLPAGPPSPLGPNGTFMVYRPIQQDVPAFERYVTEEADRLELNHDLVRAKIVGRWPDGTPLTLSPERPNATIASNRVRSNDFLYGEQRDGYRGDPDGFGCPLGAHIRRTYPRDALPGGGERSMRHRIIRRGMPYGRSDSGDECGLAFICLSASIRDGFEFIQRMWCNAGDAFGLGSERDLILQQDAPKELTGMVIQGRGNTSVVLAPPPHPLVRVRGCEYLFLPSRRACSWLTSLR